MDPLENQILPAKRLREAIQAAFFRAAGALTCRQEAALCRLPPADCATLRDRLFQSALKQFSGAPFKMKSAVSLFSIGLDREL